MPGGYGDFDLYISEKKGDTWSLPRNLGPKVNSAKKEAFPFIHESGLLFYSSNNSGMGGFDIFVANLNAPDPNVKNIGEPFNSTDDDLGFILSPNAMTGYFNSSRRMRSFGQDDIFVFQTQEPLTNETVIINTAMNIADNDTKAAISGAAIRIFERNGNGLVNNGNMFDVLIQSNQNGSSQLKLVRKQTSNLGDPDKYSTSNGEAKYDFKNEREYLILVSKEGYDDEEYNYSTINKRETNDNINVLLKKPGCAALQGIVKEASNNTPLADVKVTISDGNKVVLVTRTDASGHYSACLKGNVNHSISYEKDGYNANASQSFLTGSNINKEYSTEYALVATPKKEIEKPITKGSVIVLENIYYDFNKAIIRADATKELDALANLMQRYPSMEIELVAHTDSRGKNTFNEKLSTQRALAAKNYLAGLGIAQSRIAYRGAGESQIRNQCLDGVDCEEAQHQYNRRTEVRVTKIDDAAVEVKYGN
jgi:outer membrane protein OmpA-like peptidoglycan-associated protein